MSNEDRSNSSDQRSWLDRISQAISGEPRDRDSLVDILRDAQRRGLLDADQLAMIEGALHVSEMQVRDIMIPRSQMVVVRRDASTDELLPPMIESGHSRFPVIGENRDDVIGILIAKDLLQFSSAGQSSRFDMREVMRPALFVPESKRLDVMLKEFRSSRNHLAVVVDEYGGVAGMVTIEDVLEQIVGEIDDEHDVADDTYILSHREEGSVIKALTPVEDFNEHFGTSLSDEEFDTVGGFVAHAFGHVPGRGEAVVLEDHRFEVVRADNRRIHLLMVRRQEEGESADEDGNNNRHTASS